MEDLTVPFNLKLILIYFKKKINKILKILFLDENIQRLNGTSTFNIQP